MDRVANKTVVVTGGGKGIGEACCRRLAEEGARVAVADIDDGAAERVAEAIRGGGGDAAAWHLDVAVEEDWISTLGGIHAHFGSIDALVNNAGIAGANKPTDTLTRDEWEAVMAVNVTGVFLGTKHVLPYLRERGRGSVVNLSSIYGIIGAGDIPPYHASKGAVRLMTKNDAITYAAEGIRFNSVHPGYIWTPLVEDLARDSGADPANFRRELDARHPLGHVGEPDDIAFGVVYLVSEESRFMTGSELVIDGGYTAW